MTIVEMKDELASDAFFINKASLMPMLNQYQVQQLTGHRVLSFEKNGSRIQTADGNEIFIEADTMINSFGMKPNTDLADRIMAQYPTKTRRIGDVNNIGKVGNAIRAGFFAALSIDAVKANKREFQLN